jgi:phage FluMu gp28-like protein
MRFRLIVTGVPGTWKAILYKESANQEEVFDDYVEDNIYTTRFGAYILSRLWAHRAAYRNMAKPKTIVDTEFREDG